MRISTQRVRELRHAQTEAEKAAWHLLRDRRLGLKFRRQYPIENYVVDFYCCEIRLAVELRAGFFSVASVLKLFTAQKHRESHELNDNHRTGISQEAQEARGMQQRCAKRTQQIGLRLAGSE